MFAFSNLQPYFVCLRRVGRRLAHVSSEAHFNPFKKSHKYIYYIKTILQLYQSSRKNLCGDFWKIFQTFHCCNVTISLVPDINVARKYTMKSLAVCFWYFLRNFSWKLACLVPRCIQKCPQHRSSSTSSLPRSELFRPSKSLQYFTNSVCKLICVSEFQKT